MKGLLRSAGGFLQCLLVLVSLHSPSVTINAAKFHVDERVELQRSMARYLTPNEYYRSESTRDLLQVDMEEMKDSGQAEATIAEEPLVFPEPYLLGPKVTNWDEQRRNWLEENPYMKSMPNGKPRVLIVTGSQPNACYRPGGDHFHIKSLKLKIDYARMHNFEIYYNLALLDPLLDLYWVKLPTVRKLMLTHPEIEWFLWVDSDALFTDMLFEPPFHDLEREGYNMAMWSWEYGFRQRDWVAVNVGVFLIRNCQWSLDLFDKWSPMGPRGPTRDVYGKMLTKYLTNRPDNYAADDQSALVYLMLTDEAVMSKIKLVEEDYIMSGWWVDFVDTFDRAVEKFHPGLGDRRWPWITHFTGCQPCNGGNNPEYSYENCMFNITRALNFADNQVLAYMGYQHQNLSEANSTVIRTREETASPLDFVGVNPWEQRIAQLAAETAGTY